MDFPSDEKKPEDFRHKHVCAYYGRFEELENKYKVIYPENENATYSSLLNYSDDLEKPFQRWYRYKEGFSIDLVKHLIGEYSRHKGGLILDPFAGSGSTLLAARQAGYRGVGFEVNPFSYFLAKCKLDVYTGETAESFKQQYERILKSAQKRPLAYELPKLSISEKVFDKPVEVFYMTLDRLIDSSDIEDEKVRNLLRLGWLSCLEPVSNYRKAGNGLKRRKYVKPRVVTVEEVSAALLEEYRNIYQDILTGRDERESVLYRDSCLHMRRYIEGESVTGIIYSPPYANCFDYTEIYKLELWFGKFVSEYSQLRELRKQSLHSHLNGNLNVETETKSETLKGLLDELQKRELWDKKIPKMLALYYDDMFHVLKESYQVLEEKGFCCIVVGNSAYGGIIFPADLILSEYAEKIGYTVDKIEVDRYIITSSQQYEITKEAGKYLRESVVCLVKNES